MVPHFCLVCGSPRLNGIFELPSESLTHALVSARLTRILELQSEVRDDLEVAGDLIDDWVDECSFATVPVSQQVCVCVCVLIKQLLVIRQCVTDHRGSFVIKGELLAISL